MSGRTVLKGGDIVLFDGVMRGGVVVVENGKIGSVCHESEFVPLENDSVIDCGGHFVSPGFIDLHNQGGGGFTVMDGSWEHVSGMCRVHAEHGTTGLLLTPLVEDETFRGLLPRLAGTVGKDTGGAAVLGIHAEGPFLNPKRLGCMPRNAVREPDPGLLDEILELCGGKLVEMTVAPEMPGAPEIILKLAREGVVPSLGHSDATLEDVLRAVDHGASHVTHFFNAMRPMNHREPGLAGAALYSTELSVEVIADGFHIHPWILGLVVQNKGIRLTCLITDAMPVMGLEDGEHFSLGQRVKLENGRLSLAGDPSVLAGSVLSMDRAVANMVNMVGLSLADAVAMASAAPAAVLGIEDRKGRLEEGFDADIAVLDRRYETRLTMVEGRIVFDALEKGNRPSPVLP